MLKNWKRNTFIFVSGVGMMIGSIIMVVWGGFKNKVVTMIMAMSIIGVSITMLGFPSYCLISWADYLKGSNHLIMILGLGDGSSLLFDYATEDIQNNYFADRIDYLTAFEHIQYTLAVFKK